jgi:2-succinyl-6-hydroxy-2,4-cyclohexadiene-1-carboxylate synthase
MPALQSRYTVVRLCLPGHHPADTGCTSFDDAALFVAASLRAADPPRTLLGYSLGGRLALHTALRYPDLVESLILESATAGIENDEERQTRKAADDQLAQDIRIKGLDWFVEYWANIPLFESQQRLPTNVRDEQRRIRLNHSPEGLAQSLEKMGAGVMLPMWKRLHTLTCPVHLITGALDVRYTQLAQRMQAAMPHARHTSIADAGHTPHLEAAQPYLRAVLD